MPRRDARHASRGPSRSPAGSRAGCRCCWSRVLLGAGARGRPGRPGRPGTSAAGPRPSPPPPRRPGLDLPAPAPPPRRSPRRRSPAVDPAAVRRAAGRRLRDRGPGPPRGRPWSPALDRPSRVLRRAAAPCMPASTTKLLTTTAALERLGPDAHASAPGSSPAPAGATVVLVGGGDPFLAPSPARQAAYPDRRRRHHPGPGRPRSAAPATAPRAGPGRLRRLALHRPGGQPALAGRATSPTTSSRRSPRSGSTRAGTSRLRPRGRPVAAAAADVRRRAAPGRRSRVRRARPGARPRAARRQPSSPRSTAPPLAQIVERILAVSDNEGAEVLGPPGRPGQRRRRRRSPAASRGACATLRGLGVDLTGGPVYDGSGLSRDNRLARRPCSSACCRRRRRADAPGAAGRGDRAAGGGLHRLAGLPLRRRRTRQGRGRVRAKTGTLTGVTAWPASPPTSTATRWLRRWSPTGSG